MVVPRAPRAAKAGAPATGALATLAVGALAALTVLVRDGAGLSPRAWAARGAPLTGSRLPRAQPLAGGAEGETPRVVFLKALIKEKGPPAARPPREKRMTEAQRLQDAITHAVVAVELLDWHGKLQGSLENSFKKRVYNAALPRLRRLTNRAESAKEDFRIDKNGVKQSRPSRVHDSTLERQFTLGNLFTRVALSALQRQDQATWTALAQLRGRQEFMRSEMHPDEDPAAKELVSFSQAVIEMPDGRQMQVRDRAVGHNDAQSCIWVLPVFVDHDRSTHAERQALLVILQSLPVAKDEGVPADIKGRARVFATHTPCISCLSSMCQFTRAFEGASLAVGFDVWKETRRWIGLKGPDMTPMGGNLEEKVELEPFELDC